MLKITCPHCKRNLKVPEKYAGQSVKCPACHGAFRLPPPEPVALDLEAVIIDTPPPAGSRAIDPSLWMDSPEKPKAKPRVPPDEEPIIELTVVEDHPTPPRALTPQMMPCPMCHERIVALSGRCEYCGGIFNFRRALVNETGVRTDSRAVSILQRFSEIDAGFRIAFPENLAFSLSQILVSIDAMQRSGDYPVFVALAQSTLSRYRQALVLSQTHVGEFRLMGGGFGVVGAAKGIMMAEAVNYVTGKFTKARLAQLSEQMNNLVFEASKQIEVMRQHME